MNESMVCGLLKFTVKDGLHEAGESLLFKKTIQIGQGKYCDAVLPSSSEYEDETMAVIRQDETSGSWCIIRTTPHYELLVNGVPVHIVSHLFDGDRIEIPGIRQEMEFHIREDIPFEGASKTMILSSRMSVRMMVLLFLVPILISFAVYGIITRDNLSFRQLELAGQSVFKLDVDSIQLVFIDADGKETVQETSISGQTISGTAFLTKDSLLVTARHCIEPWLNIPKSDLFKDTSKWNNEPALWALRAETYNQLSDDETRYALNTFCTLSRLEGTQFHVEGQVCSNQFTIRKDRDEIREVGGFFDDLFWRSISAHHQCFDMMLDDVAYRKYCKAGNIERLSDSKKMKDLLDKGKKLYFVGYPSTQEISMDVEEDRLRIPWKEGKMLFHNGSLKPGFSGGPVLVRQLTGFCAVGLVSVIDPINDTRGYSVPLTEINLKK